MKYIMVMNEKKNFNEKAQEWHNNISQRTFDVAEDLINRLNISEGCNLLDVAAGTGILYSFLMNRKLRKYVAVDISDKMIEKFKEIYKEADVRVMDFEKRTVFEEAFDYIVIFNSIPHFNDLDAVFQNAYDNLKTSGKFIIAHSKTRQGLKEHHRSIGYKCNKEEPIPLDEEFIMLCDKYEFRELVLEDEDYFYFCVSK